MILTMAKARILGPREALPEVLRTIQDVGVLHLAEPAVAREIQRAPLTPRQARERRHLARALEDVEATLEGLGGPPRAGPREAVAPGVADFAHWARLAARVRRMLARVDDRATALAEEHALIHKYRHFFSAFQSLLESAARWPNATVYHVLLRSGEAGTILQLRTALAEAIGDDFALHTQRLPTGETALLVVVSQRAAGRVERLLAEARVQESPVPASFGGSSLADAIPRMLARLGELPAERERLREERAALARAHGDELSRARIGIRDRLRELDALPHTAVSRRAFVLEGWLPAGARSRFEAALAARFGDRVVVTEVAREEWTSEQAPVVLRNPRLFRPFEAVIRLLPLPRYGTIDPTPFVAVFFPAFFGLMLGDIGYGLLLGSIALVLHRRSTPETLLRSVAEIAGACAVMTVIAGVLYGEFFGDLGRRWFGLRALAFDREEALVPFLLLAVALGAVHIVLGLGLGVVSARRHPRQAIGRGVSLVMVLLLGLALLAAAGVLPAAFFTPAVIGLMVAFPILIIAEGIIAPIELLSTIGNILSYARIMALGVASVMLAVVANRMVGAIGSVTVGVMFALIFHLVNFAIGLFSPTIHALRLHYVEFFGKFYSPGGVQYRPFAHWSSDAARERAKP